MLRVSCLLAPLLGLCLTCSAAAVEILPLDQLRPGMKGIGRTVFEGTQIEEFEVEIIGVLENTGPRRSMILARLTGGPLQQTGVIAGMSGSPVLIDGKLVGAVAYGFPFSKETIAGITPIGEMIEATSTQAPRAAAARFPVSLWTGELVMPLDGEALVAAVRRSLPTVTPAPGTLPASLAGNALRPLPLPMVFSGFDPTTFDWARGVFADLGFTPVLGKTRAGLPDEPLPAPEPGAAVGVSLIEGDLDLSATGTLTHIDENNRVYAFGHPFYNLGPTQFPLKKAYVYSVFPSLYQSWKITATAEPIGTVLQDRVSAIAGQLGEAPRMIPVEVNLKTNRGGQRPFSFRIVEDELFTPVLAYISLLSVLQANERAFGTSTIALSATLVTSQGATIHLDDVFARNTPSVKAAALVAAPMAYLLANDKQKVAIERLDVEIVSHETVESAVLERAWIDRSGPIRPGSELAVRLALRTYRGETVVRTIPLPIPSNARPGRYTLLVADGSTLTAFEQRQMRQPFVPRNVDQLVRAINGLRRNHYLYARLLTAEPGAIVGGEYLQSLPPSVLSVLSSSNPGPNVTRINMTSIWDADLEMDHAVSGSRRLRMVIEP